MSGGFIRTLLILFPALALLNAFVFMSRLRRMVEDLGILSSTGDIRRFRREVGYQMYAALLQIALLTAPMVLYFIGLFSHRLRPPDVLYVIVPSAVVLVVGKIMKRVEQQAKNMPASTPDFEKERDRVVRVWDTKPLPDWRD
ncbi:hypothetical protein JW921_10025 [Candidatus Fermentibacterales bacterium]|nr:hypothetical protein [Candidatus Fermentibacterales bacterium]